MAGRYGLTNRFHPSGLIVSVGCISTTAGSLGVVIQPQTTDQTSYFLTQTLETTLTLISPSPTHGVVTSSAGVRGAAAERRADRKKEKYSKQQLPGCIIASVTPLVMEHFGAWGIDGWKLLCKLAKKSSDKVGRPNAAEFIDFWSKRFSIQLQKCNARVISKKLSSLSEDNRCDLFATQYFSH